MLIGAGSCCAIKVAVQHKKLMRKCAASCGHFADLRTPRRPIHKYKLQQPMKFNVQCREPSPASPINIGIQSFAIQWFAIQLFVIQSFVIQLFVIQWFVIQWFAIQWFAIQSFEL
jgi:hypothetical protein